MANNLRPVTKYYLHKYMLNIYVGENKTTGHTIQKGKALPTGMFLKSLTIECKIKVINGKYEYYFLCFIPVIRF